MALFNTIYLIIYPWESQSSFVCVFYKFNCFRPLGHFLQIHGQLGQLKEKAMAAHSSPLAWKIPRMEEPGGLQSMGLQRVGQDWATSLSLFTLMHWRRKWQPTPVFLPGESQGRGRRGLPSMGSHRVGHNWSDLAAAAGQLKIPYHSYSQVPTTVQPGSLRPLGLSSQLLSLTVLPIPLYPVSILACF